MKWHSNTGHPCCKQQCHPLCPKCSLFHFDQIPGLDLCVSVLPSALTLLVDTVPPKIPTPAQEELFAARLVCPAWIRAHVCCLVSPKLCVTQVQSCPHIPFCQWCARATALPSSELFMTTGKISTSSTRYRDLLRSLYSKMCGHRRGMHHPPAG